MRVNVTGEFNLVGFNRTVFGIDPDDLEPCALPGPNEVLGTQVDVESMSEEERATFFAELRRTMPR